MHWSQINPVLISLFTDLAVDQIQQPAPPGGVPYYDEETPKWEAEWKERRGPFIHPGQAMQLLLKVTTVVGKGGDEYRYEAKPNPADPSGPVDLFQNICGFRKFTLQVQVWVPAHEDNHWAMETTERIRTRLGLTSSCQRLLAVNVDFTDVKQAIKLTQTIDGRRWSIASMDVILTAAINDVDPIPIGWIERIDLTSRIQAGGVDIVVPLNGEEVLPPLP